MKIVVKWHGKDVAKRAKEGTFRSLNHAAAAIRLTARRSIRRRKKPSAPGQPPHTQTGHLKRMIAYEVDKQNQLADIGPVNKYAQTIWHLHEFGGVRTVRLLRPHQFKVGEFGQIRKTGKNEFARIKLETQAQANRATRLVAEENRERLSRGRRRRYPKRPFMGPALLANKNRLPEFWRNSVN